MWDIVDFSDGLKNLESMRRIYYLYPVTVLKGSGNESEILMLMLDKSTYFKKAALFSLQSVFFMYNIQLANGRPQDLK